MLQCHGFMPAMAVAGSPARLQRSHGAPPHGPGTADNTGAPAGARCLDSEPKAVRQACRMDSPDPAAQGSFVDRSASRWEDLTAICHSDSEVW